MSKDILTIKVDKNTYNRNPAAAFYDVGWRDGKEAGRKEMKFEIMRNLRKLTSFLIGETEKKEGEL